MITDAEDLPESELFKKMVYVSIALHLSFFIFFGLKTFLFPREAMNMAPAVRVDLVDLPDKISELPPTDSKVTSKSPPPKPKEEMAPPLKKSKLSAIERIKQFEKEEKKKKSIENIEKEVEQQEKMERTERARKYLVKGNVLSPGTALQGLTKSEFNDYLAQMHEKVQNHWNLPEWLSNANLKATVTVNIDSKGNIIKRRISRSSGDPRFDDFALKAIDESSPLPPPPDKFVDMVRVDGVSFGFPQ